jgi:hypothetical protein
LDHGRVNFEDEFTLIPVFLGLFGGVVTLMLAMTEKRTSTDFFIFFWTMLLMIWVGVMGLGLHVNADLSETGEQIVWERFIRGAPVMAPMLFANMGLLGLITMVGAEVQKREA